jgi:hypothetical protein
MEIYLGLIEDYEGKARVAVMTSQGTSRRLFPFRSTGHAQPAREREDGAGHGSIDKQSHGGSQQSRHASPRTGGG